MAEDGTEEDTDTLQRSKGLRRKQMAILTIYAPVLAAGAMAFSSVTVVLNALRLRRFGR